MPEAQLCRDCQEDAAMQAYCRLARVCKVPLAPAWHNHHTCCKPHDKYHMAMHHLGWQERCTALQHIICRKSYGTVPCCGIEATLTWAALTLALLVYSRPAKRSHFSVRIASALRISWSAGMHPVDSMVKMKWSLRLRSCMHSRHRSCSSSRRTYRHISHSSHTKSALHCTCIQ